MWSVKENYKQVLTLNLYIKALRQFKDIMDIPKQGFHEGNTSLQW